MMVKNFPKPPMKITRNVAWSYIIVLVMIQIQTLILRNIFKMKQMSWSEAEHLDYLQTTMTGYVKRVHQLQRFASPG